MKLFKVRIILETEQEAGNVAAELKDAVLLVSGTHVYAIVHGDDRMEAVAITKEAVRAKLVQVLRQLTPLEASIARRNAAARRREA